MGTWITRFKRTRRSGEAPSAEAGVGPTGCSLPARVAVLAAACAVTGGRRRLGKARGCRARPARSSIERVGSPPPCPAGCVRAEQHCALRAARAMRLAQLAEGRL